MEILRLPLTGLINNIIQTPKGQNVLNLKEGSIVPATVVELRGGSFATVQIAGINFKAKLLADLQVGDMVNLLVTGNINQEAVELKLISKISNNDVNQQLLDIDGLANILDIANKEEAKPLLKELLQRGIPVNPEIIQNALKTLNQLSPGSVNSSTLANIIEFGIPIFPDTLTAIQTLEDNFNFHELLSKLTSNTQGILEKGLANSLPKNILDSLQQIQNTVKLLLNESASSIELNNKVQLLGLDYELKVANLINNGLDTNLNPTLKHLLLLLQAQSSHLQKAGLNQLVDNVDTLLNHITGQQLITQNAQDKSGQVYSFFSIPLNTNEVNQTIEFQVMSKNKAGSKTIDPINCYILMHLQMPNLGELDIHMNFVEKNLNMRFVSERPDEIQLLDKKEIQKVLKDLGFNLDMFKIEEKENFNSRLSVFPPIISHRKIDLKV